ncbi:unnamed protein product [Clonostachys rosea]|uniref:Uncharacterized protein n=1 Tax=Bionectria ochroleuca TaxID=29856 RepID=A0ABY6TT98_BIOOC|nr:unnamed protein product [Clonostachys rosea]
MEKFMTKSGSLAQDAFRKAATSFADASEQVAKILDDVDWQDVQARVEGAASSVQESVEGAYHHTAKIMDDVDWEDVRVRVEEAASSVQESVEDAYHRTGEAIKENPKFFYAAAGVTAGAAVAPLVMPVVLGAAGFSSIGPVAGSVAAGLQSAGWAGGAGTVFSTVQSAAMGGYGVSAVTSAFMGAGAVVGGAVGAGADCTAGACKEKSKDERV